MVPLRGDSVDVCTADDAAAAECGGRNANGLAGAGVVSNVPRDFSGSSGVLSQLDDADRQLRSGALTPTPSTSGGGPTPHSPSIIARGGTPEAADTGHISSPPSAGRSSNDGQRPDDNSGDGAAMESIPAEGSRARSNSNTGDVLAPLRDSTRVERRTVSTFADQLATATLKAPDRLAERFSEQLQQCCLEEAGLGLNTFTWDLPLPSARRSFMNQVAREFVSRVEALGFERVEWWSGREWRQSQGRFSILHDHVYDRYLMRLRVQWLDRPTPEMQQEIAA